MYEYLVLCVYDYTASVRSAGQYCSEHSLEF